MAPRRESHDPSGLHLREGVQGGGSARGATGEVPRVRRRLDHRAGVEARPAPQRLRGRPGVVARDEPHGFGRAGDGADAERERSGCRCGGYDGPARGIRSSARAAGFGAIPGRRRILSRREAPDPHRRGRRSPGRRDGGVPVAPARDSDSRRGRRGARTTGDRVGRAGRHGPEPACRRRCRGARKIPRRNGSPG